MKPAAAATRVSLALALALVCLPTAPGRTEELDFDLLLDTQVKPHEFPKIEPELRLTAGYGFFDLTGSKQVGEYEYLHDSLAFEGLLRYFNYPHRIHLDFQEKNKKDYYGDVWYSYKENFLVRFTSKSLFHNQGTRSLVDLNPATPSPGISVKDFGGDKGVRAGDNSAYLRLKAPDFPSHLYVTFVQTQREGKTQLISMGGSGFFSSQVRRSQTRDLDLETTTVTLGANSHLGPIEVDYSHSEKQLNVGGDKVLYDRYGAAAPYRLPGEWPHNQIARTSGGTDTFKLHTTYSGRIVASATVARSDQMNDDSDAQSDTFLGAGSVTLLVSDRLSLNLHYRHLDVNVDNPDSVTVTDKSNPANTYGDREVRPSLSTLTRTGSLAVRYRPFLPLSLKAQYSFENVEREDWEQWHLPQSTQKGTTMLSATQRIGKGIKLDAQFINQSIQDPAYNVDPDSANEGRLSLSWLIAEKISTSLSYQLRKEKRDGLHYLSDAGKPISGANKREVERNMVFGAATYPIRQNLSLTASVAYQNNQIEQDIAYNVTPPVGGSSLPRVDTGGSSDTSGYNIALSLAYQPLAALKFDASVSRTKGDGDFTTASEDLNLPAPIGSFSKLRTKETVVMLSGQYAFTEHFSTGIAYQYRDLDDELDNANDDVADGQLHAVFMTLTRKW